LASHKDCHAVVWHVADQRQDAAQFHVGQVYITCHTMLDGEPTPSQ